MTVKVIQGQRRAAERESEAREKQKLYVHVREYLTRKPSDVSQDLQQTEISMSVECV